MLAKKGKETKMISERVVGTVAGTGNIRKALVALSITAAAVSSLYGATNTWFASNLEYIGPADRGPAGGVSLVGDSAGRRNLSCWGWADVANKVPFDADTVCWIASNTKGIAAALVLTLVDEGLLGLDDPVSRYLPEFVSLRVKEKDGTIRSAKNAMTLRHTLSHTSGLPFFPEMPIDARPMRLLAQLGAETPLLADPGTRFQYSNWGIDVAVAVTEVVTGRPWEESLQERILDPLEMKDTVFWPDNDQLRRLAKGYKLTAEGDRIETACVQLRDLAGKKPRYAEAGGGLFSTANDLYRFFRMLAGRGRAENGRRIISEKLIRELYAKQTPQTLSNQYSLGMIVNPSEGTVNHGGAWSTRGWADWKNSTVRLYMVQTAGENDDTVACKQEWERVSREFFRR